MRRKIPSLHSLLCFEAAAKHASYTQAALELSMTQSAVSRQIQHLEDFLALRLFKRTRHGVELTVAGRHYYARICPDLLGLERSTLELMSQQGQTTHLNIAVSSTFATHWLLPRLQHFYQRHPEITVHLTSPPPSPSFLSTEHELDAVIRTQKTTTLQDDEANTSCHFLMQGNLVAVCSIQLIQHYCPDLNIKDIDDHSLNYKQLIKLPLLQNSTQPDLWKKWFQEQNFDHPNAYAGSQLASFSMLIAAVTHHLGMALIPKIFIEKEIQQQHFVIVSSHSYSENQYDHFFYPQAQPSTALQKFQAWLHTEIVG